MSKHNSYGTSRKGIKKRNVLKRYERIEALIAQGKLVKGEITRVTGLVKTHPVLN